MESYVELWVRGNPDSGAIKTMNIEGLATKITTAYIKSSVNSVTEESQLLKIISDVTSALKSLPEIIETK
jgi:hypothetical protein